MHAGFYLDKQLVQILRCFESRECFLGGQAADLCTI